MGSGILKTLTVLSTKDTSLMAYLMGTEFLVSTTHIKVTPAGLEMGSVKVLVHTSTRLTVKLKYTLASGKIQ
jgi:hypothetical protein